MGALSALAAGMYLQLTDREFQVPGLAGIGFNMLVMLMAGMMISVLSQMGFFAYLTLHYIGLGLFKNKIYWNTIQIILIAIVLFDTVYLRYLKYAEQGAGAASFLPLPAIILAVSLMVSYLKIKATNRSAWIPTLFFMVVATTMEAIPALNLDQPNPGLVFLMVTILLCCNAWQILMLHKLVKPANALAQTGVQQKNGERRQT